MLASTVRALDLMRKDLRGKKRADLALAVKVFVRAHAARQLAGQHLLDTLMMQCCLDLHVALLWRFKHNMLVYTAYSFRARRSRRIPFRNAHKYQGGLINL